MAMSKENVQGSDELHEMYCELCKTKRRSRPAEGFCIDCVKYFCSVCSENHSDFLPNHVLKDKFGMPQDVCLKPCAVHSDEIIKFYCNSCKQFFCSQCKQKKHRKCSRVSHLPQFVEKLEIKSKTLDTCQALSKIINNVHKRKETVTSNMKSEEIRATEARTVLDQQSKAMTDWIENSRKQLTQEINKLESSNRAMLQSEMTELDTLEMKTEALLKDINNKQSAGNKCELFMSLIIAEEMTNTDIVSGVQGSEITQYKFEITEDLSNILKDRKLGYVKKYDFEGRRPFNIKPTEAHLRTTIQDFNEILKTLTPQEERELVNTEVLANTNIDKSSGIISIEGPVIEVADLKSELQTRLLNIERRRYEVKIAEDNYKLFRWYFEEMTEVGIEHVEYEKVLNLKIEQAYIATENEVKFSTDEGEVFVIDLVNLVEYPKNDRTDTVKVLRKDILKQASEPLPQEWAPMKDGQNLRNVNVPNTDKIYKDIEQRFLTEVKSGQYTGRIQFDKSKLQVSKIERIQNKTLYQQYAAKKRLIKEQKPNLQANMPIERELWHGTTHDAVDRIEMHGFNRSYCGKHCTWYGAGVYFARCASYSTRGWLTGANPGTTEVKGYIFLSKVLTGQYCKGNLNMRYLPPVDPNKPTVLYDCAVDNDQNPMEFVIFHDTQAYPEYIVTFTA